MKQILVILTLTLPLFSRPEYFIGFGRIEKDGFVPDGEKTAFRLECAEKFEVGTRLWVLGYGRGNVIFVDEFLRLPKEGAKAIPKSHTAGSLSIELVSVDPWCDHMPIVGPGERRQYLIVTLKFKNQTDLSVEIALKRSFLSLDESKEGSPVSGLSLRSKEGTGSGKTALTLKGGEERTVQWRGDNLYEEGHHQRSLYVILSFASGKEQWLVRNSGIVRVTE